MDRRGFFRIALSSAGAAACLPTAAMAGATPVGRGRRGQPTGDTAGPYGSIEGATPDTNGLLLPGGLHLPAPGGGR